MITKILVLGMMAQAISSARGHLTPDIDSTQPEVLVRIFDTGGISGMTMTHAELVARQIMASAGVKVRFAVSAPRRRELQTGACETAARDRNHRRSSCLFRSG